MKKFTQKKVIAHFKDSEEYKTHKEMIPPELDPIIRDSIRSHASSEDKLLEER
jgi:hypothetical protein